MEHEHITAPQLVYSLVKVFKCYTDDDIKTLVNDNPKLDEKFIKFVCMSLLKNIHGNMFGLPLESDLTLDFDSKVDNAYSKPKALYTKTMDQTISMFMEYIILLYAYNRQTKSKVVKKSVEYSIFDYVTRFLTYDLVPMNMHGQNYKIEISYLLSHDLIGEEFLNLLNTGYGEYMMHVLPQSITTLIFKNLHESILHQCIFSKYSDYDTYCNVVFFMDNLVNMPIKKERYFCNELVKLDYESIKAADERTDGNIDDIVNNSLFLSVINFSYGNVKMKKKVKTRFVQFDRFIKSCDMDELVEKYISIYYVVIKNPKTRSSIIEIMSYILCKNIHYTKMQINFDNFDCLPIIYNLSHILYYMSLKVDVEKVDVLYFSRHDCLLKDLTSDSRISCTIKEVEEFDQVIQKENPDVKSNFNSHCFFFLALSYEETIIYLFRLKEYQNGYIENFKKTRIKLDAFRKSRNMDSLDSIIMFMDFFINDFSNTIDVTEKYFTLNDASRNVIYYIDRLSAVVASMISINKDESLDKIFRMFPERFLQIIINASEYLMSSRLLMPKSDTMNIFKVIILGICRHDIFISPYMVSKFINVLQILLPIHYPLVSKTNYIIDDLNMKNHIPKAIMNYYVNVENTGSSNDFYDKFSIRFSINLLLRKLWYNQDAKEKMIEFSKTSEFIKFINMALNDVIYLFDENISTLKKMKNTQMVINDVSKYNALTENEQKMRRQELQNSERILLSMIKLLMQLLKMIVMFTLKIKEPFMKEELLDRFTVMLNFTFYELSGENSASIKIDNPEKIGWSPCDIVKNLIHIYINLSNEKFIESMAKDERSFDSNKFKSACERLKETKIPNIELEHMINIIEEAESFKRRLQLKEVYYGEIPQKYRDPLMDTLMLNPVKLPGGGVMDKHVILRHLLNSSTDPFNRNYLDESLLVEDVDLKQEIDQWIMSKHKNMSDQ